ncbi:MAG: 1,4-alpha-glucan branching protein domain-containing protein, partial [Treponemataceae bacterium]
SDWQKMVKDDFHATFAQQEFSKKINSISEIYEALGANNLNTEKIFREDAQENIFSWINYHVFSSKVT